MIDKLVKKFNLLSHPEGGFYAETYRSEGLIDNRSLPSNMKAGFRNYSTGIIFLLPNGEKSRFHRIKSDEMWHFYLGGPMSVVEIHDNGKVFETVLGRDIDNGELLQYVVPANCWFGSFPHDSTEFSLVGCTVSPGFDFHDFELADKLDLLSKYPLAKKYIEKLCD